MSRNFGTATFSKASKGFEAMVNLTNLSYKITVVSANTRSHVCIQSGLTVGMLS
jgi:hypothetical protein